MWLPRQIGQRPILASSVDELGPINFDHNFYEVYPLNLDQFWGDWWAESEKDVHSPRRLTHWADPANSAFNLGPIQLVLNVDPLRPNILEGLPFQTGEPLLRSTGLALQFLGDLNLDILTQETDLHWPAVPLRVQGFTNTEWPVKKLLEAQLSNGRGSRRGVHNRHSSYSLENGWGHLKVIRARKKASRQWEAALEWRPVQTPQGDFLAYSQGKEMWWKYTLIQLLGASPQPMSRKAIVEAAVQIWVSRRQSRPQLW